MRQQNPLNANGKKWKGRAEVKSYVCRGHMLPVMSQHVPGQHLLQLLQRQERQRSAQQTVGQVATQQGDAQQHHIDCVKKTMSRLLFHFRHSPQSYLRGGAGRWIDLVTQMASGN